MEWLMNKFAAFFILIPLFSYFSALKMEAKFFSETPVDFELTLRHYIPKDIILHALACIYIFVFVEPFHLVILGSPV
jgi:hypothetical protein